VFSVVGIDKKKRRFNSTLSIGIGKPGMYDKLNPRTTRASYNLSLHIP